MQPTRVQLPEIKLVGLNVRTNNKEDKMAPCIQHYFQQQVADKIPQRKNPGTTFFAYTDWESDHTGEYTFYIGEEVGAIDNIPEGLASHIIPSQTYIKWPDA